MTFPKISNSTKVMAVIGDPIHKSLSPIMHNAALKALGLNFEYSFIACKVESRNLKNSLEAIKELGFIGLSVTMPHKQAILKYLNEIDETVEAIGAVNTVINTGGKLIGYNTDWIGFLTPLKKVCNLEGKSVALIGAGGAARAACFALKKCGAKITIFNRTTKNAETLANDFCTNNYKIEAKNLNELQELASNFKIIINSSSLGMQGFNENFPNIAKSLNEDSIVFDMVYRPHNTALIQMTKNAKGTVVHGIEMLLYQGMEQFKLFTRCDAPEEVMRSSLQDKIN
jgi:shikimate dehydrogenase